MTGDQSNLSGVTHSILHGFNYSPLEVPFPGWIMYGAFLNEVIAAEIVLRSLATGC